jgi:uncharacterized membrane protein YgcG
LNFNNGNAANVITSMSNHVNPIAMKQRILLLFVLVTALGSCTTMYKSGQTPDDVYFSPTREVPAYVETDNRREDRYMGEDEFLDDRYLRMKAMNRNRWSAFDDDFMYWNDYRWNNQVYFNTLRPYSFNNFGFGYNPMMGFGNGFHSGFYNPFYPGFYGNPVIVVARPVNPRAYVPRNGNLGTYRPTTSSFSTDPKTGNRMYNLSGSRTISNRSSGGSYYTNPSNRSSRTYSNGNESRTYSAPSRSFDNSNSSGSSRSSGGSSSGSSSGGSAPVRSFPRGGN